MAGAVDKRRTNDMVTVTLRGPDGAVKETREVDSSPKSKHEQAKLQAQKQALKE